MILTLLVMEREVSVLFASAMSREGDETKNEAIQENRGTELLGALVCGC